MKKPTPEQQRDSLLESLSRLQLSLQVAQTEKNSRAELSITKIIHCFERKLKSLKLVDKHK